MACIANVAKGRIAYYASLPAASDALVVIPLEAAGLEADSALQDYTTVAVMLAGPSNEQTTIGRKTLTSGVTATIDQTANKVIVTVGQQTWTSGTGNPIGKLCVAYDPDSTTGTDADLIPLCYLDFAVTPDGTDIVAQVGAGGIAQAQ